MIPEIGDNFNIFKILETIYTCFAEFQDKTDQIWRDS